MCCPAAVSVSSESSDSGGTAVLLLGHRQLGLDLLNSHGSWIFNIIQNTHKKSQGLCMYDKEMIAQGHAKSHETDKQAD